uniref:FHA domain-containing protein n=1 Tax=Phytophthora ramorum TaxID=164328 RepID=H3GI48_PHYRM
MPATSPPQIVLRVRESSENNEKAADQVTQPLSPIASAGIVLGSGFRATFKLRDDPEVDAAHGTLERTSGLGVWVFSDHSSRGSMLNGERVHHDAAVVRHGDKLKLGQTEIEVCLATEKDADPQEEEKEQVSPVGNQETELSARGAARLARRRASTPWGSVLSVSKAQQAKQRLPRIETSGLGFVEPGAFEAVQPEATPPEYSASPVPGTRWRRKRNSIATTTLMSAMRSPSPPLDQQGHPHSFHRPRTRFIQGSDMPPRSCPDPVAIPIGDTVSKKMAAAAPTKASVPRVIPKVLEFQAPASPVAQKDILEQQESLQTILQHKFEEEQLLKQQQEEWMKQHLMPASSSGTEHRSGSSTPTPPLSPIKSEKESPTDIDPDELAFFPVQAPVLLRTLSLGLSEQRTLKPSPRLTAAIRASRARLNSFEERPNMSKHRDRKGRRKTTALVLSPNMRRKFGEKISSSVKENELRASDESVTSTASTIITCHRRVTSSISSDSASSVDLGDFIGYEEEDVADTVTSYTTPDLYGSAELLRRSSLTQQPHWGLGYGVPEVDASTRSLRTSQRQLSRTNSSLRFKSFADQLLDPKMQMKVKAHPNPSRFEDVQPFVATR